MSRAALEGRSLSEFALVCELRHGSLAGASHPYRAAGTAAGRENGIDHLLTAPRSPTTTGKIERWHKTLRREFLNGKVFASMADAQTPRRWVEPAADQSIGRIPPIERFKIVLDAETTAATSTARPPPALGGKVAQRLADPDEAVHAKTDTGLGRSRLVRQRVRRHQLPGGLEAPAPPGSSRRRRRHSRSASATSSSAPTRSHPQRAVANPGGRGSTPLGDFADLDACSVTPSEHSRGANRHAKYMHAHEDGADPQRPRRRPPPPQRRPSKGGRCRSSPWRAASLAGASHPYRAAGTAAGPGHVSVSNRQPTRATTRGDRARRLGGRRARPPPALGGEGRSAPR